MKILYLLPEADCGGTIGFHCGRGPHADKQDDMRHGRCLVSAAAMSVAAAVALLAAGCGSDAPPVVNTTQPVTEISGPDLPTTCLGESGLVDVERRGEDLWRGFHPALSYIVTVRQLAGEGQARSLARDATDAHVARSGVYVVVGPANERGGSLLTADEGAEAQRIVNGVAGCLG